MRGGWSPQSESLLMSAAGMRALANSASGDGGDGSGEAGGSNCVLAAPSSSAEGEVGAAGAVGRGGRTRPLRHRRISRPTVVNGCGGSEGNDEKENGVCAMGRSCTPRPAADDGTDGGCCRRDGGAAPLYPFRQKLWLWVKRLIVLKVACSVLLRPRPEAWMRP